jgi:cytochrome c553
MRRRRTALAAAALVAATVAVSLPSSRVAWTLETVKFVRSGDPARGKQLHKDCAECHGPTGIIDTPEVPNLAGQDPLYTFKQLQDYKNESRSSPTVMVDASKPLSDRDMADLAAFYARQAPAPSPASPPTTNAGVARLVSVGDGARLIPACEACHGAGVAGAPGSYGMPDLTNQKLEDLSLQLTSFRSGERANDVYRVMREVCRKLTDAEIAGLAAYYSKTAPGKAASSPPAPSPPPAAPPDKK